jgi:hypothetical protein
MGNIIAKYVGYFCLVNVLSLLELQKKSNVFKGSYLQPGIQVFIWLQFVLFVVLKYIEILLITVQK